MKLHNTLTRKTEDFKPISSKTVKLYTCGPTVYDYTHIGNLRSFIFDDTLRRALEIEGFDVQLVMNITDVGHLVSDADEGADKLEKGAAREGKTVWEVADFYTEAFKKDMEALNILMPNGYKGRTDGYARATDFIEEQINFIQVLVDKGFVYQTTQAMYFDVTKLPDYGKLTGQKLSDKEVAARSEVVTDPEKKHPYDFAVWFFTVGHFKDHTMHWASPWGEGFPGWHLECSTIIHEILHDPIDIHTGGVDHIGTHHTNEMAQTEAAFGHELANYWVHNEFILVDGTKMSKSKDNFYTLADVIKKGFDPLAFRLLVLQAHYRSELNFTWESLTAAQNRLQDLQAWADLRHQPSAEAMPEELDLLFRDTLQAMHEDLRNDLNTPEALSALGKLVSWMQQHPVPGVEGTYTKGALQALDDMLGLNLASRPDITAEQKQLIAGRTKARETSDWTKSDQIRDQLLQQGIGIRDTDWGPQWFRVTHP